MRIDPKILKAWKRSDTPEMGELSVRLQVRRHDEDYSDDTFADDLAEALYLAFKAGYESERL